MGRVTAKLFTHFGILVIFSSFASITYKEYKSPGKTAQTVQVFPGLYYAYAVRPACQSLLRYAAGVIPVIFLKTLEK